MAGYIKMDPFIKFAKTICHVNAAISYYKTVCVKPDGCTLHSHGFWNISSKKYDVTLYSLHTRVYIICTTGNKCTTFKKHTLLIMLAGLSKLFHQATTLVHT